MRPLRATSTCDWEGDVGRPADVRFGGLGHAALAAVPLDANDTQFARFAFLHARILGNDESDAVAAVTTVRSVLAHPFMTLAREAAGKGQCRRETPVTLTLADGTLIEGVLDLAFCEKDEWTVVDFKRRGGSRVLCVCPFVKSDIMRPAEIILVRRRHYGN